MKGILDGSNPVGDARLAKDLLPPVMLGPDSTARIDEHLARVACPACGQPTPTIDRAAHLDSLLTRALADEGNEESVMAAVDRAERVIMVTARAQMGIDLFTNFGPDMLNSVIDIVNTAHVDRVAALNKADALCKRFSAAVTAASKLGAA